MKRIDIRDLPHLTGEHLVENRVYAVARDGEDLGMLIAKRREDPDARRQEEARFRQLLADYRENRWLRDEILDQLERWPAEPEAVGPEARRLLRAFMPPMSRVALCDFVAWTGDEEHLVNSYAVERDGALVGYFMPRLKKDPAAVRAAWDAFDQTIDRVTRHGYTREQLEEDFDLSKPFREDI